MRSAAWLLALAAALPTAWADNTPSGQPCAEEAVMQQRWLDALNALRAEGAVCGGLDGLAAQATGPAPALHWAPQLARGAHGLAEDLAAQGRLSHTDSGDRHLADRLREQGYRYVSAGENLAAGQADFAHTLTAWLASPSHCVTLMRSRYTEVGLACVQRPDSPHGRYWVAKFGRPAEALAQAQTPAPGR